MSRSVRAGLVLALVAGSFLAAPASEGTSCVAPQAEFLGPMHVSHGDRVVVTGKYWFEGCCDTPGEPSDCTMTPSKNLRVILREKHSSEETPVVRHLDANRRWRFRTSFMIHRKLDPGSYRVSVEKRDGYRVRAGRLVVESS